MAGPPPPTPRWSSTRGGGLEPGERFDLFGGISIGRSADADVRIEDRYASGVHARLYSRGANYYVEDMNSTNGTFLNGGRLDGEAKLNDLDEVRIGDTEFRFELEVPGSELMLRIVEQAYRTDTGRQRNANEDSYFARPPLFAVADGMGGAQAGEVASRLAAESFEPVAARRGVARGLPAGDRQDGQRPHPPPRPGRLLALGNGDDADRRAGRGRRGRASPTSATAAPTCFATAS